MSSTFNHQFFASDDRVSQSLCNDRCQNILYKTVFEHFVELRHIGTLLLASKSFQNSSFGANFVVNFTVDDDSIGLIDAVLAPTSCFSLQFVPSLPIRQAKYDPEKVNSGIAKFVGELVKTKYFHLSLQSLTLDSATTEVLLFFFGSSGNSWPQLRDLRLDMCNLKDSDLEIISQNSVQLQTANFSHNWEMTDVGLDHISQVPGITNLNIRHCNKITDVGLEFISQLPRVTSLDLSFCIAITDVGLEHVSKLSGIASLKLNGCHKITDAGLAHIATLSSITGLDLSSCYAITDDGILHVSALSGINILGLYDCTLITDVGMKHVSSLVGITSLNLWGCDEITDVGLGHLVKLSNLSFLCLTRCDNVTIEAKTVLTTAVPNCKILD